MYPNKKNDPDRNKRTLPTSNAVIGYSLPTYHEGQKCFVDFFQLDPIQGKLRRKKYHLDGLPTRTQRRARAKEIITNITAKLRDGWNVWADTSNSRAFTPWNDVCEYYRCYVIKLEKEAVIKQKTKTDYLNRLNQFITYTLQKRSTPIMYIYQFDLTLCADFLDYILIERDTKAVTRNSYRIWLSSFANWMIEKSYITENPISKIRTLAVHDKERTAIPKKELTRMKEYLSQHNSYFLLACMMEYYTFIRPGELMTLRLADFNIKDQCVYISGENAKNRKDSKVGLNERLIKLMLELGIFECPSHYYLFSKELRPGEKKTKDAMLRYHWLKMVEALKWPDTYKFYSLKDSGIRDLAQSEGIVVARDQARHADVSTTNLYLRGRDLPVHESTKNFDGAL